MLGMQISKSDRKEKVFKTNCYTCGVELLLNEAKKNPDNKQDTRFFCLPDWKKRFGKKKKLIKRY